MIENLKDLLALLLPDSAFWTVVLALCAVLVSLLMPDRAIMRRAFLKGIAYVWGRFFRCPFGRHSEGIGAATFGESGLEGFSVCRYCGRVKEF